MYLRCHLALHNKLHITSSLALTGALANGISHKALPCLRGEQPKVQLDDTLAGYFAAMPRTRTVTVSWAELLFEWPKARRRRGVR